MILTDVEVDRYGDGGVVEELEAEVAGLLGMPAALFLASGTMAQQPRSGACRRRVPLLDCLPPRLSSRLARREGLPTLAQPGRSPNW